ncbi:MAG: hypothetical protein VKI39_03270 [Synechococcus sp.]|nr:hypothetical protein [Synechococcus sp.]
MKPAVGPAPIRYPMAPLIRLTLIGLYLALVAPLPLLASGEVRAALWLALPLGFGLLFAATSEEVELSDRGISVGHPPWCAWLLRRGWSLAWTAIDGLTPVATSQGGQVFYVRSMDGAAYLLPQRVAGFEDFLGRFTEATGLATGAIGRISPPWTYQLLAGLTGAMLLGEVAFAVARWWTGAP